MLIKIYNLWKGHLDEPPKVEGAKEIPQSNGSLKQNKMEQNKEVNGSTSSNGTSGGKVQIVLQIGDQEVAFGELAVDQINNVAGHKTIVTDIHSMKKSNVRANK